MTSFSLSPADSQKIHQWLQNKVYPEIAAQQKAAGGFLASMVMEDGETVQPYFGAIGGAVTYSFTPTSLGTVVKATVEYGPDIYTLDLTNYEEW